ncbi:MAG: hypothetical protein PVH18_06890, partial [Chloroflexota bacterium]
MKILASAILGGACILFAGSAFAGNCVEGGPGQYQDLLIDAYSGTGAPTPGGSVDNLGQALAAGYYGNTANAGIDSDAPTDRPGVTPAGQASPGPKVGGTNWEPGASLGHAITC